RAQAVGRARRVSLEHAPEQTSNDGAGLRRLSLAEDEVRGLGSARRLTGPLRSRRRLNRRPGGRLSRPDRNPQHVLLVRRAGGAPALGYSSPPEVPPSRRYGRLLFVGRGAIRFRLPSGVIGGCSRWSEGVGFPAPPFWRSRRRSRSES